MRLTVSVFAVAWDALNVANRSGNDFQGADSRASEVTHKKNGAGAKPFPVFNCSSCDSSRSVTAYEQTMAPVLFEQVLADCEWVAVALQLCGGPAATFATMVTFCDGLKPWRGEAIVAVPLK